MDKIKKHKWWILISLGIILLTISIVVFANNTETTDNTEVSTTENNEKAIVEMTALLARGKDANSKVTKTALQNELNIVRGSNRTTVTDVSGKNSLLVTFSDTGRAYEVDIDTGALVVEEELPPWISPSEIFDSTGTNPNKLHIGDFIEYDAGRWTQEKTNQIETGYVGYLSKANGNMSIPNQPFQFGGFNVDQSRNFNAYPWNMGYAFIQSSSAPINGWRLFDIEQDGKIVLISAGNPEDYNLGNYSGVSGYANEYVLSNNINADFPMYTMFIIRNWNDYVNINQKALNATTLSKTRLDDWYSKYIVQNADTGNTETFKKIYEEQYIRYQNIIDNYSYYWLSTAYDADQLYYFEPSKLLLDHGSANGYGVRILVSLSPDVLFSSTKTGTKTLTGGNMNTYGGDQTYNVWNIK